MNIFSTLFGRDPEAQKQSAFQEIEQRLEGAEINQAKAGWLTMRGNDYAMRRRFTKAIEDYKEALQFEVDRPSTLISLGAAYNHKHMWEYGIAILEKAKPFLSSIENDLMRTMQEHNLYYALGSAYFFTDNKKPAIENLSASLEAFEAIMKFRNTGVISEEQWRVTQKMMKRTVKNAELFLARVSR